MTSGAATLQFALSVCADVCGEPVLYIVFSRDLTPPRTPVHSKMKCDSPRNAGGEPGGGGSDNWSRRKMERLIFFRLAVDVWVTSP